MNSAKILETRAAKESVWERYGIVHIRYIEVLKYEERRKFTSMKRLLVRVDPRRDSS